MTPDESAWVQTLREWQRWLQSQFAMMPRAQPDALDLRRCRALTAAIAALEALQKIAVCESDCANGCALENARLIAASALSAAPSETAKDERIRALEEALARAAFALGEIGRGRAGATSAVCAGRAQHAAFEINRVLHHHQSWCRTEHEGACIPDEPGAGGP